MLSHFGSAFREWADNGCGARYVLFSMWVDQAAIGSGPDNTLVGLTTRAYTSPASKFPAEMRDALPPSLRSLLEWELPDGDAEPDVPLAGGLPRHSSAPLTRFQPPKL